MYKKRLTIIENNLDFAKYYTELLSFDNSIGVDELIYNTEYGKFHFSFIDDKNSRRAFLVDINLNPNLKNEAGGLEVMKDIRRIIPEALIIAYSGKFLKKSALEAGANYFFLKEPGYEKRDFKIIKQIILDYFEEVLEAVEETSRELKKSGEKDTIQRVQNNFLRNHHEHKLESAQNKYNTVKSVSKKKQEQLHRLMQAEAETLPDNVETKLSHEDRIKTLKDEIGICEKELDDLQQNIVELQKSLDNLL